MTIVATESDKMLASIMDFTATVVGIASIKNVENSVKAEAIFVAEKLLHKIVMDKIVEKCAKTSTPCQN